MLSSFKPAAKAVVGLSLVTIAANPLLNRLIAPLPTEPATPTAPFDPSVTDVLGYSSLNFLRDGERMPESWIGLGYIFTQVTPRWITTLLEKYNANANAEGHTIMETPEVDILDARKATGINFEESGFVLIDVSDDAETTKSVSSWRGESGGIRDFQDKLEVYLREILPNATRIQFTYNVIRGGHTFGDQPAAVDYPHLDYTQNDTAREKFHEEYPPMGISKEHQALLGRLDTEEEEVTQLLGIWKPVLMPNNPVCDRPLAVMDGRTFSKEHEELHPIHMNFGVWFHNLNGVIRHDPSQRWYYYPFQTEDEVLVFRQYTRGRHFANPHTSFVNRNCPEGYESRISVEMRVAVFERKKKVEEVWE